MQSIVRRAVVSAFGALVLSAALQPADARAQSFEPNRFSVEVRGEGPDVIFIPGLGSSRDVWAEQASALAATHRVHLVQLAGFAGEPATSGPGPILDPLVEELARYIASNGVEAPAVIGHSMGGLVSLMLARRHPERVDRALVVDSLPFYSAMFGPQMTVEAVEPQARRARDQVAAASDAAFLSQQRTAMARLVKTEARRQQVLDWSLASERATFAQAMYEAMITDMRREVASIQTPLTILYAYDPAMGPEATVEGLYRGGYAAAPNATFVRIDGAFHFIMFDQPAAFQAAVEDFLR